MKLSDQVAFITGANRGLGLALVHALQAQGVKKIYAGVRDVASISLEGVIAVQLDVTNPAQVAAAAAVAGDVTLLINNAGLARMASGLDAGAVDAGTAMFDANVLGIVRMAQAFAPVLANAGGGAMVNILSVASWVNGPPLSMYAATKSAAWGVTNGLRSSLAEQHTLVTGVHVGFMDTDMTAGIDLPKLSPHDAATIIVAGIASGDEEILVDDISRQVKQGLTGGIYLAPLER